MRSLFGDDRNRQVVNDARLKSVVARDYVIVQRHIRWGHVARDHVSMATRICQNDEYLEKAT